MSHRSLYQLLTHCVWWCFSVNGALGHSPGALRTVPTRRFPALSRAPPVDVECHDHGPRATGQRPPALRPVALSRQGTWTVPALSPSAHLRLPCAPMVSRVSQPGSHTSTNILLPKIFLRNLLPNPHHSNQNTTVWSRWIIFLTRPFSPLSPLLVLGSSSVSRLPED